MKKVVLMLLIVVLLSGFVNAELFEFYNEDIFTAKKFFDVKELSSLYFLSPVTMRVVETVGGFKEKVEKETTDKNIEIVITESAFVPAIVQVKVGDTVVWKNERKRLKSLIVGMREINEIRSGFILPGEEFSWKFNQKGKFVYVDGVVIGVNGKIIVE